MPESSFVFTSNMVYEVSFSNRDRNGNNPLHNSLENCSDFVKLTWDLFLGFTPFVKKELRDRSPKRSLKEWKKEEIIFTLKYENGIFEFHIHPLAAKRLGLPEVSTFKDFLMFYMETYCIIRKQT